MKFDDSNQYAIAINTLLVSGIIDVKNDIHNGNTPGRVLRGPGYKL